MLLASTPLDKGINFLSQASMYLAFLLLVYFLIIGPTLLQLNSFTQEIGVYLANIVPQSLRLSASTLNSRNGWALGRSSSGRRGSPGARTWAPSSPASPGDAPSESSSSGC
jgi:hypothetical protein